MNKYYKILEFDKIIEQLKKHTTLEESKKRLNHFELLDTVESVQKSLNETDEASVLIKRVGDLPMIHDENISFISILMKAHKGGIHQAFEVFKVGNLLDKIKECIIYLEKIKNFKIPSQLLEEQVHQFIYLKDLNQKIKKIINEYGELKEDASVTLHSLLKEQRNTEKLIQIKLQEFLRNQSSKLSEQLISIRNDRYVVPVKNDYKNQVKGIIHDQSSSGETVYIEPLVVFELNNQLNHLKELEQQEVVKILKDVSLNIDEYYHELLNDFEIFVYLDIVYAKAKYSLEIDGKKPKINNQGIIELYRCYHPLLNVEKIVKNNIFIGKDYQGIIITGPNTGGKTVLLKTVGLLSLMIKFGLLIPCDENSQMMIFDHVYADIGDEQSIDQNLSTFSSHITNVIEIIHHVTDHSLVLLDELGSGTDPLEGASLAIAIFDEFLSKNCLIMATSHYSELKIHAFNSKKMINASVEFDSKTLKPTYRLLIGVPGMSNAIQIATSLGLPDKIIHHAQNYVHEQNTNLNLVLDQLIQQSKSLDDQLKKIEEERIFLQQKEKELEDEMISAKEDRNKIIQEANKAKELLLQSTKQEMDDLLTSLKQIKEKPIKMHEIAQIKHRVSELYDSSLHESTSDANLEIHVGDFVFVKSYQIVGKVLKILKNDMYEVEMGIVTTKIKKEDMKIAHPVDNHITYKKSDTSPASTRKQILSTLDLRGSRYEEAEEKLDKFLDDAIYGNLNSISIIHGFGTGVIRNLVQEKLKNNKSIIRYRFGGPGEGGQGVTIVTLKE